MPLLGSHGRVGVLGVVPRPWGRFVDSEQRQILETFAAQTAGALERARIAAEAEAARLEVETERLRSSLLSSVSHDLRTPLAVITGAATTLLSASEAVDPPAQRDLLSAIYDESVRLTRLVVNLLDMTRLSAGALKVNKEWQSIEAVVGAAIGRVEDRLGGRPLEVHVPASLPLVPFDAVLIEQVLINLLENAAKYSPAAAPIKVSAATARSREIVIDVADRGPGVPEAARPRIFEKFYRLPGAPAGGAGLGLAICRGIVEAHGGRIGVVDREGGGSRFRFTLPIGGSPPAVEEDGGAS
jgi:two-component system sensor histidine kinase KdpD